MSIFPMDDPKFAATYAEEAAAVDAAEIIAGALEDSGMSQADLARKLKVSPSEIVARLRGERNITVKKLAATLHALGHSLVLEAAPASSESKGDEGESERDHDTVVDFSRYRDNHRRDSMHGWPETATVARMLAGRAR